MWTSRSVLTFSMIAMVVFGPACSKQDRAKSQESRDHTPPGFPVAGQEGSTSGRGSVPAPNDAMTFQRPAFTNVEAILLQSNPLALSTQPVQFVNATVQRMLNPRYVLVGPDEQRTVLVRLKEANRWIRSGDRIKVSGVIMPLGEDLSQWNLSPEDRALLKKHAIFINAIN